MRRYKRIAILVPLFFATFLFNANAFATILNVPSDYDNIQKAINNADSGDTISVAAGRDRLTESGYSGEVTGAPREYDSPEISNLIITQATSTSFVVEWDTDEPTTFTLDYGLDETYGQVVSGSTLETSHSVLISGLSQDTEYHLMITVEDSYNNTTRSPDLTVITTTSPVPGVLTIYNLRVAYRGTESFAISFNTDITAIGELRYGVTDSYGNSAVGDSSTIHLLEAENLLPSTLYHYQVYCTGGGDSVTTSDFTITTALESIFNDVTAESNIVNDEVVRNAFLFDYNNDGFEDIYILNRSYNPDEISDFNILYENSGPPDYIFSDVTDAALLTGDTEMTNSGAAYADFDGDGYIDILILKPYLQNYLYRNRGDGTFEDVAEEMGIASLLEPASTRYGIFFDYDNDSYLDLLMDSVYLFYLLHNNSNAGFTLAQDTVYLYRYGRGAIEDYDNDGDMDVLLRRSGSQGLVCLENNGNGTFTQIDKADLGLDNGPFFNIEHITFADYDNDGDMDLYITRSTPGGDKLYRNMGSETGNYVFTDVTNDVINVPDIYNDDFSKRGAYFFDVDNDGDLDILNTADGGSTYNPTYGRLLLNQGADTAGGYYFIDSTDAHGLHHPLTTGFYCWIHPVDYDNDGDIDIFASSVSDIALYNNTGNSNNWIEVKLQGAYANAKGVGAHVYVTAGGITQARTIGCNSIPEQNNYTAHFGLGANTEVDIEVMWPGNLAVSNLSGISANQIITLDEAQATNHAPQFDPTGDYYLYESDWLVFTVSATDQEQDPIIYWAEDLPAGAVFNSDTREFSWQPTSAQVGTHIVTFCASDGQLVGRSSVTILVIEQGDIGVQLLLNPGFEDGTVGTPNPNFPVDWSAQWTPVQAGAQALFDGRYSGSYGLWIYTDGSTTGNSWVQISQEFSAQPGDVYTGRAWIRTPPPSVWVDWSAGSAAFIRIEFLDGSTVISSYDSPAVTVEDSGWGEYSVETAPAPEGTAGVRYICYLNKPDNGEAVQSVANFDDCYFELTSQLPLSPQMNINPYTVGLTKYQTQAQFKIQNAGILPFNWSLSETETWITSVLPAGGSLTAGEETTVTVIVDRAGLTDDTYQGSIQITSDAGDETITVYMDMPGGYNIPDAHSIVSTGGYRLLVRKRLPDGSTDEIEPYVIKGAAWSPVSIGNSGNIAERKNDFQNWYITDIQLLKDMGANTVYTFLDFGTGQEAMDILDNLYKNGFMAIVTVDEGINNTVKITEIVNAYKDHPAVLMWALGNEWNINYYHGKFGDPNSPNVASLQASAEATESAAQQIKALDTIHPVASIHGEIDMDGRQPLLPTGGYLSTQEIVNIVCPTVDVWGTNIYRSDNFGTLFTQWAAISGKPMFLSEFGTDSYFSTTWYPVVGYESESSQSNRLDSLWIDLEPEVSAYDVEKVCLGGTPFEWNDEWWKAPGTPDTHDNGGFDTWWNPYAHPDGFANEEYFGIVSIERRKKQIYSTLQAHFSSVLNFAPIALPWDVNAKRGVPRVITLNGIDVEQSPLTYEIVDGPVHGDLGPVAGDTVTYTSHTGYIGEDSFTYRCFDGQAYSTPAPVTITVTSGGGCFLAGTPILMSDGTTRSIEKLKIGDTLLAFDEESGEVKPDTVKHVFVFPNEEEYLVINGQLKVTLSHVFAIWGQVYEGLSQEPRPVPFHLASWVSAGQLKIGDMLMNTKGKPEKIASIKHVQENVTVYNLEVNPYHTFIAGGVVVHNAQLFQQRRLIKRPIIP